MFFALLILFFVIFLLTPLSALSRDFVSYSLVVTCNYVITSTSILFKALFYSKVVNNWRRSLTETFLLNFLSFLRQKLSILAFFFNSLSLYIYIYTYVFSDECLGAKLRVTENRCVLFNSETHVYLALLPQQWAIYAKVDSAHIHLYIIEAEVASFVCAVVGRSWWKDAPWNIVVIFLRGPDMLAEFGRVSEFCVSGWCGFCI